jgi:hypothetical protein
MDHSTIATEFRMLDSTLNEKTRRRWAAARALVLGFGGVDAVARATGMSTNTIRAGIQELKSPELHLADAKAGKHIRSAGGGRKDTEVASPGIMDALNKLIEPHTIGHPESPLRWTTKSTRKLAAELATMGYTVSPTTVAKLLRRAGYSLQGLAKKRALASHPDRNKQFEFINSQVELLLGEDQPVISVDTKKKELIGSFHNNGVEWRPKKDPIRVNDHDFPDASLGKAIPYGVYDVGANQGLVNVGVDHDTPQFAVESIRIWWKQMGKDRYPNATKLMITADGGGSNGHRVKAWKTNLQSFADETGLQILVSHFPPGASKWNKIEHRMFNHISMNWRGRPLVNIESVVNLIGATTSSNGLRIISNLDRKIYPTGLQVSENELSMVNITKSEFHGDWNYTIFPRHFNAS